MRTRYLQTSPWLRPEDLKLLQTAVSGLPFVKDVWHPVSPVLFREDEYRQMVACCSTLLEEFLLQCRSIAPAPEALASVLKSPESHRSSNPWEKTFDLSLTMNRCDVLLEGGIPKILEFNIGGATGGIMTTHELVKFFSARQSQMKVEFIDPLEARGRFIAKICDQVGIAPKVILLGTMREYNVGDRRYFDEEVAYYRAMGIDACFTEPEELASVIVARARDGRVPVIRHYLDEEWVSYGIDVCLVNSLLDRYSIPLGPRHTKLLENKRVFAWLSKSAEITTSERTELVRRHIPWTRELYDQEVIYKGMKAPLGDLVRGEKNCFVLKPSDGYGGTGNVFGTTTSTSDWCRLLSRHWGRDTMIVQEIVQPDSTEVWFTDGIEMRSSHVSPVLGCYEFGGESAGCLVRHYNAWQVASPSVNAAAGASMNLVALIPETQSNRASGLKREYKW